jgi:arylsulfatase A
MTDRRTFLLSCGLSAAPIRTRPPNIVIALCDDLGYGDLSCYGHPVIKTPHLDRFAQQGIRFTDCYAAAPVCSPSRAGLLTGRTPDRAGIYDWIPANSPMHLRREEVTISRLLQQAGYATCHSGKWHLNGMFNSAAQPQPGDHGFDHWFATQNNAAPSHLDPVNFVRNGKEVGPLRGHSSRLIVDEAIEWLRSVDRSRPYFLFVCFHSPHEPVAADEDFVRPYASDPERNRAIYYGNVAQTDHEFGRLMQALEQRGDFDNTFAMFTSDNGPETLKRYPGAARSYGSAAPLRSMKLSLYEGGYRVPGMIRFPRRVKAGRSSSVPICSLDLLPTLCGLAGIRVPQRKLDGADISAALDGKPVKRPRPLHWHYSNALDAPRASLREGDWKVLGIPSKPSGRAPGGGQSKPDDYDLARFELYNLRLDPGEKNDLAAKEPVKLAAMKKALLTAHEDVKADWPTWG